MFIISTVCKIYYTNFLLTDHIDACTASENQIFSTSDFWCKCTDENDCTPVVNNCSPNPCQNNGTCVDDGVNFSCICAPGFTDEKCGTNIDNCLSNNNPCQNNGICTDTITGYICTCIAGFTGDTCSNIIVNSCTNNSKFVYQNC